MIRILEKHEKPPFLPFLALFSKFTFLAITPEEEPFWTCDFYQKKPTIKLLFDTKNQNDSTTQTGEIFERLSGNVNSVPFENRILDLDFRAEGVKIVAIWHGAFKKYCLWSSWKSNRISVCSFRSRDIRIWKSGPKFPIFKFLGHNSRTRYFLDMRFSPKGAQCYLLNACKKSKKSNEGFGSNKKTRNFSPNSKTARTRFSVPIFGVKE